MRLVHGESDGLPGLIVDQYNEVIVVQFLSAGVEYWRESIIEIILRITNAKYIYERSDVDVRQLEGLPLQKGLLTRCRTLKIQYQIDEHGLKFLVDMVDGHKTGYYLDQRDNRLISQDNFQWKKGVGLLFIHGWVCYKLTY